MNNWFQVKQFVSYKYKNFMQLGGIHIDHFRSRKKAYIDFAPIVRRGFSIAFRGHSRVCRLVKFGADRELPKGVIIESLGRFSLFDTDLRKVGGKKGSVLVLKQSAARIADALANPIGLIISCKVLVLCRLLAMSELTEFTRELVVVQVQIDQIYQIR